MNLRIPIGILKTFLLVLAQVVTCQLMAQNALLAYYPLDGNADDATGNEHHATEKNGRYTTDRFGNENSAYLLDNFQSHITIPPILDLSNPEWTYSLWLKLDKLPNESGYSDAFLLSNKDVRFLGDVHLFVDDEDNRVKTYSSNDGKFDSQFELLKDQWYHLLISYNGNNQVEIWIDGVKYLTTNISFPQQGNELIIGSVLDYQENKGRIIGVVDDVKIYDQRLSEDEIQSEFVENDFNLIIPNVITPNGDYVNDLFVIGNALGVKNMRIFNRWGQLVFSKENYNGSFDGNNLSDGIYFYTFDQLLFNDRREFRSGTLTILR